MLIVNWVVFWLIDYGSYLYILDIKPLSDMWFANVFSHPVSWLFILLIVSFDAQKLILMKSSSFFSFVACVHVDFGLYNDYLLMLGKQSGFCWAFRSLIMTRLTEKLVYGTIYGPAAHSLCTAEQAGQTRCHLCLIKEYSLGSVFFQWVPNGLCLSKRLPQWWGEVISSLF